MGNGFLAAIGVSQALFAREFASRWNVDEELTRAHEAYVALGAIGHAARLDRFREKNIFV